jgi:hypothetical protein
MKTELNDKELQKLGGLKGVEANLNTDYRHGLKSKEADLQNRRDIYGRNEVRKTESFLKSFKVL